MFNLAHRDGHDTYAPLMPGETVTVQLPLLPTEWVFEQGHSLRLELRAARAMDWALVGPGQPGLLTLHGGEEGTALVVPLAPGPAEPLAATQAE
jgi:hypothetical protein